MPKMKLSDRSMSISSVARQKKRSPADGDRRYHFGEVADFPLQRAEFFPYSLRHCRNPAEFGSHAGSGNHRFTAPPTTLVPAKVWWTFPFR